MIACKDDNEKTQVATNHPPIPIYSTIILHIVSFSVKSTTDEWTMFRHDTSHNGATTGNSSANYAKLLWNCTTGGAVWSSPAVSNGYVS